MKTGSNKEEEDVPKDAPDASSMIASICAAASQSHHQEQQDQFQDIYLESESPTSSAPSIEQPAALDNVTRFNEVSTIVNEECSSPGADSQDMIAAVEDAEKQEDHQLEVEGVEEDGTHNNANAESPPHCSPIQEEQHCNERHSIVLVENNLSRPALETAESHWMVSTMPPTGTVPCQLEEGEGNNKRRKLVVIFVTLMALIAVIVTGVVVYSTLRRNDNTATDQDKSSNIDKDQVLNTWRDELIHQGVSLQSDFTDFDSSRSQALFWLVYQEDESSSLRVQRYILLVLAFECGGNQWRKIGTRWTNLYNVHECQWGGVECTSSTVQEQQVVTSLQLSNVAMVGMLPQEIGSLTHLGTIMLFVTRVRSGLLQMCLLLARRTHARSCCDTHATFYSIPSSR